MQLSPRQTCSNRHPDARQYVLSLRWYETVNQIHPSYEYLGVVHHRRQLNEPENGGTDVQLVYNQITTTLEIRDLGFDRKLGFLSCT